MAGVTAALIGAGAGLVGDIFSSAGQSATNAQNLAIAQMNNQFNAQQADINRTFQANQADIQRKFQASQVQSAEDYQTQMSDTAEQRRVGDLKMAGLNPLLAATAGAASAPTISPASGSMPGGSQASASGNPVMQNPRSSLANLGGQVSSAIQAGNSAAQVQSQVDVNNAQADLLRAQRIKTAGPDTAKTIQDTQTSAAQASQNQAAAKLDDAYRETAVPAAAARDQASASLSQQQVINARAELPKIIAQIQQLQSATSLQDAQRIVAIAQSFTEGLKANQMALLMPDVAAELHTQVQLLQNKLPESGVNADFYKSSLGKFNPVLHQTILPIVNTAASVAGVMRGLMPSAGAAGPSGPSFNMDLSQ